MSTVVYTVADLVPHLADASMRMKILSLVPQQKPFRFIDEITELSADHVVGKYTFRSDEFFYAGHFPENPVTPGVILLECMAQIGLVTMARYLLILEGKNENLTTLFTDAQVEFQALVLPGTEVIVRSEKTFWRRNKLKANVTMLLKDGKIAASGTLSGMGI